MALLAHNNLMVAVYLVVFIHSVSPVTVSWWMSWRATTSCLRSRSRALRSLCVLLRSGTSPHAKEEREHTHSSSGSWYLWVDVLFTIFLRERNNKNSFIRLLVKQYASFTVSAHCNLIQYNMTATMIQHVSSFELKKKDIPYCVLMGELWDASYEYFGENLLSIPHSRRYYIFWVQLISIGTSSTEILWLRLKVFIGGIVCFSAWLPFMASLPHLQAWEFSGFFLISGFFTT